MGIKVTLSSEDEDMVVREALEQAISLNLIPNNDEGGFPIGLDMELIDAMCKTLEYFSSPAQYSDFMNSIKDK